MSLSPNEDLARALQLPPKLVANATMPGLRGVNARIMAEMSRANTLAMARELDRCFEDGHILIGVAFSAGACLAAAILGFTADQPERREQLLASPLEEMIRSATLNTLHPPSDIFEHGVTSVPVARA